MNSHKNLFDVRPWGWYLTLYNTPTTKTKVITVNPGESLSTQYHNYRDEHWVIISGNGEVLVGQEASRVVSGSKIYIPNGTIHNASCSIENNVPLVFIEVAISTEKDKEVDEEDIARLEDKYGRQ